MKFDQEVLSAIKSGVVSALKNSDYATESAIKKPLVNSINAFSDQIEAQYRAALAEILDDESFKKTIKEQVRQSLARSIVGSMKSSCDKVVNTLKSNPVTNAELVKAVNDVLSQYNSDAA